MAQSRPHVDHLKVIGSETLDSNWAIIGAGGFCQVYKARHRQRKTDVAVKMLYRDDGTSSEEDLAREAVLMLSADCPYIMRVLEVFRGHTPYSPATYVGLVMELMEGGSLYSLQKKRECQPLPWPLVFRLVHQVAVGMNYLHSLTPALIHKDLKPQNILLDSCLNVKITDFGIAKFANSTTAIPVKGMCTAFYAPPEASQGGATAAYDVYSYAILMWTILNPAYIIAKGEESHPVRPSLKDVRKLKAPGLEELVELMERCWNQDPDQRPTFAECTAVTEGLYTKNTRGIREAVFKVQLELDGVRQPYVPEPDVPEPDVPEPDVPQPDVPQPDVLQCDFQRLTILNKYSSVCLCEDRQAVALRQACIIRTESSRDRFGRDRFNRTTTRIRSGTGAPNYIFRSHR